MTVSDVLAKLDSAVCWPWRSARQFSSVILTIKPCDDYICKYCMPLLHRYVSDYFRWVGHQLHNVQAVYTVGTSCCQLGEDSMLEFCPHNIRHVGVEGSRRSSIHMYTVHCALYWELVTILIESVQFHKVLLSSSMYEWAISSEYAQTVMYAWCHCDIITSEYMCSVWVKYM